MLPKFLKHYLKTKFKYVVVIHRVHESLASEIPKIYYSPIPKSKDPLDSNLTIYNHFIDFSIYDIFNNQYRTDVDDTIVASIYRFTINKKSDYLYSIDSFYRPIVCIKSTIDNKYSAYEYNKITCDTYDKLLSILKSRFSKSESSVYDVLMIVRGEIIEYHEIVNKIKT
jgi:hypothetical protein